MKQIALVVFVALLMGVFTTQAFADTGSFSSSDPQLDQIWSAAVRTADDMLAPGGQQVDALGRPCPTSGGVTVILDGVVRDRCPYIGDESVIDLTYDSADPHFDVQRDMLAMFAAGQQDGGAIPASPAGFVLFDYCGYWAITLHNYVLYSGDTGFGREMWPALVKLLDRWYPEQMGANGLLDNSRYGHADYAFIRRHGDQVAYFNAQYVYVLKLSAQLAEWLGHTSYRNEWIARARAVSLAFAPYWDGATSAFTDTLTDRATHPEDGNAFAILAGIATPAQATAALSYLSAHNAYSYGNSIADVPTWDDPTWGYDANLRVYPFIGFYELLARFQTGLDSSALDMIGREWGYMTQYGKGGGTDWEIIGPYGGAPTDPHLGGSWDAGWSSGAAPALTQYVLGVRPTSPGYATYTVDPHPGDLDWAKGTVVTPRGILHVSWKEVDVAVGRRVSGLEVTSYLTPR
jgi:hypothetical protein